MYISVVPIQVLPLIIFQTESSDDEHGDDDVNLAKKGRGRPKKAGTNEVEVNICVILAQPIWPYSTIFGPNWLR